MRTLIRRRSLQITLAALVLLGLTTTAIVLSRRTVLAQGFVLPLPQFYATDANGAPLSGGKVYTYEAGTTTPAPTYSDEAITTLNANPVILDSAGRATIFIPDNSVRLYKIVVKTSADVTVYTVDGVSLPTSATPPPAVDIPVGTIMAYGGTSAPSGYLLCDGSAVSRTTYADLFAIVGTAFGAGNGSTTFNVPDLRQRVPLGVAASGTGSTLGGTGGTIDHTHTVAAHEHTITHTHSVPRDGWGTVSNTPAADGRVKTGDAAGTGAEASANQATADNTSGASSAANTGTVAEVTSGTGNPPFQAVHFIVKT